MLFSNCSFCEDEALVMLHKIPGQTYEMHNLPLLMLWDIRLNSICGANRFPLEQKQMVGQNDSKAEVINNSSTFWKAFIFFFSQGNPISLDEL